MGIINLRDMQGKAAQTTHIVTQKRVRVATKTDRAANNIVGRNPARRAQEHGKPGFDLVLSSGFLAFANHCGFLSAVDEIGLPVNAVMGTSAGALTGSLYCAGFSPAQVAEILSKTTPIKRLRPSYSPWAGGVLSMSAVVDELQGLLPPSFEQLKKPLGVGVASCSGEHLLVDSGCLPQPVAASAAIPFVFEPVEIPGLSGGPFMDGGVHCRIGLQLWREGRYARGTGRPAPTAVVHLIGRSSPFSGNDDISNFDKLNAAVVKAPKSGKSFWDLGDFDAEFEAARKRALPVLRTFMEQQAERAEQEKQSEDFEQPWQYPQRSAVF